MGKKPSQQSPKDYDDLDLDGERKTWFEAFKDWVKSDPIPSQKNSLGKTHQPDGKLKKR